MTKKGLTPEQLEYDELIKKMRLATTKLRITQEGIDVLSLSKQKMDMITRIFDEMEQINKDNQSKTSKIQQDSNIQIQKVNQETGKKFTEIQKKYQDLIKSLKEGHEIKEEIKEEEKVPQEIIEEIRPEKTHEERVNEITDEILKSMRDSVSKKVDEMLKITDINAEIKIGKHAKSLSKEELGLLIESSKKMAVTAAIINQERPEDKDIPEITPEMMKETEEEIAKRREEKEDV